MKKLLLTISLLAGTSAMATYGDAGCGLGSMVFSSNETVSQVFAATTNGTSGSQTFGISSGTSNCVDNGAVKGAKAVPAFIEVNKTALAEDAARGQGETLAGLANLMGCKSENFGKTLKTNYKKIFVDSKMDPTKIEANINSTLVVNKTMACGA